MYKKYIYILFNLIYIFRYDLSIITDINILTPILIHTSCQSDNKVLNEKPSAQTQNFLNHFESLNRGYGFMPPTDYGSQSLQIRCVCKKFRPRDSRQPNSLENFETQCRSIGFLISPTGCINICQYVLLPIYIYVNIYLYIYVYIYIDIYTYVLKYVYVYLHIHIYIQMCICV